MFHFVIRLFQAIAVNFFCMPSLWSWQWKAYGQSKTANILHVVGLNARFGSRGLVAVALHPGVIETELWRHAGLVFKMNKSIPQGAATSVFCAVSPSVVGGAYYNDCNLATCAPYASDEGLAAKLWDFSEESTAVFAAV